MGLRVRTQFIYVSMCVVSCIVLVTIVIRFSGSSTLPETYFQFSNWNKVWISNLQQLNDEYTLQLQSLSELDISNFSWTLNEIDTRVSNFQQDGWNDVIVFIHIQKTGGSTLNKKFTQHIHNFECNCQAAKMVCDCRRPNGHIWLFSRNSVGWACGLHADFTELSTCVPQKLVELELKLNSKSHPIGSLPSDGDDANRYRFAGHVGTHRLFYVSQLRDPIQRYLSEWLHVRRGATWRTAMLRCGGRSASQQEVPFCYNGSTWQGVNLSDFLDCDSNLANNRQTRMLANLHSVGCYNNSSMPLEVREKLMLRSAIDNLRRMVFFALTEQQQRSQELFEWTFGVRFSDPFVQLEGLASDVNATQSELERIKAKNNLDIELYHFAKALFYQRYSYMRNITNSWRVDEAIS